MRKYFVAIFSLALLFLLFSITAFEAGIATFHQTSAAKSKQRGVSWVAGGEIIEDDLIPLVKNNVNWIAQNPFGWQQDYNSPTFVLATDSRILWGERDEGIEITTRMARKHGIKTLLKPHIWLRNRNDGKWLSDIAMDNEADWQSWFEHYRIFILHYAQLAEKNGIEALSVGAELHATVKLRPNEWRKIIAEVRQVYHGQLTYCANWYQEFEDVKFWDKLDFIGIQAYFPLSEKENPTIDELKKAWQTHVTAIEKIRKQYSKPVVFTEIGYRSTPDAAIKPWEWMRSSSNVYSEAELQTQASCYEAFFQTFWNKDWFAGAYIWKWFPTSRRGFRRGSDPFSPQSKPAEKVMAKWYGKTGR
ncbi:MAG: glycoside hydrolase family 113 [bacterium]